MQALQHCSVPEQQTDYQTTEPLLADLFLLPNTNNFHLVTPQQKQAHTCLGEGLIEFSDVLKN